MERTEQNKPNEEVREVSEFGKLLKEDDTMKKMDELVAKNNEILAKSAYALANADETCTKEDKLNLAELIENTQKQIEASFVLHHYYVMALYAGYIQKKYNIPDSPESPVHTTYW